MTFGLVKNKDIALILWNQEIENDVRVFLGKIIEIDDNIVFLNETKGWKMDLSEDIFVRLKKVPENLKESLLNADFAINLSVANLPDDDTENYIPTGMKAH